MYGFTSRPVVGYTLNAPESWSFVDVMSPTSGPAMIFQVDLQNTGSTDMEVRVLVGARNATVSKTGRDQLDPGFGLTVTLGAKSQRSVVLYVKPSRNAESFYVFCDVFRQHDYSDLSHIVATMFGEINGQEPTRVKYIRSSESVYTKIQ